MYILNYDKDTGRILSASANKWVILDEFSISVNKLPESDITDYIWNGTKLIFSPRSKNVLNSINSEENYFWEEIASAIRKGVNQIC